MCKPFLCEISRLPWRGAGARRGFEQASGTAFRFGLGIDSLLKHTIPNITQLTRWEREGECPPNLRDYAIAYLG